MPSPNDHARMLVELLRHGGVELSRRWIGALLLVPAAEREEVVTAVERQIVSLYASDPADDAPVSEQQLVEDSADSNSRRRARRLTPADSANIPTISPATSAASIVEAKPTRDKRPPKR